MEPSRLDRIEANLLALTELQKVREDNLRSWRFEVEQSQRDHATWQRDFRRAMDGLVESHQLAQKSAAVLDEAIAKHIEAANKYIAASAAYVAESDARMKRMEENLDNLIRIITAEHTNGKGQN